MDFGNELITLFKKKGELILIYGPSASGKSTLAMQTSLNLAKNSKVLFFDTEKSFSIDRIKLMSKDYKKLLDNIIIMPIKNFEDQCKKLDKIEEIVKIGKFDFVVIDSFGIFYRYALHNEKYKEVNEKTVKTLRNLKHVTELGVPVLVTSQVYSDSESNIKPVGGQMIKNFCSSIFELVLEPRTIIMHKPEKIEKKFKIENLGFVGT